MKGTKTEWLFNNYYLPISDKSLYNDESEQDQRHGKSVRPLTIWKGKDEKRKWEIERDQTHHTSVRARGIKKRPTRNLFLACQDDSACTVGARPDHYKRVQDRAKGRIASIKLENATEPNGGEGKRERLEEEREFSRRGYRSLFLFSLLSLRASFYNPSSVRMP